MRQRDQIRDPRPGRPNEDEIRKTNESVQKSGPENLSEQKNKQEKQHPSSRH